MRGWPPRLPMCGPAILPPILGVTMENSVHGWRAAEPTGLACLCGKTQGQPEAQAYREQQLVKLKKYRLGLAPGPQADGVDALIQEMEDGLWP